MMWRVRRIVIKRSEVFVNKLAEDDPPVSSKYR